MSVRASTHWIDCFVSRVCFIPGPQFIDSVLSLRKASGYTTNDRDTKIMVGQSPLALEVAYCEAEEAFDEWMAEETEAREQRQTREVAGIQAQLDEEAANGEWEEVDYTDEGRVMVWKGKHQRSCYTPADEKAGITETATKSLVPSRETLRRCLRGSHALVVGDSTLQYLAQRLVDSINEDTELNLTQQHHDCTGAEAHKKGIGCHNCFIGCNHPSRQPKVHYHTLYLAASLNISPSGWLDRLERN